MATTRTRRSVSDIASHPPNHIDGSLGTENYLPRTSFDSARDASGSQMSSPHSVGSGMYSPDPKNQLQFPSPTNGFFSDPWAIPPLQRAMSDSNIYGMEFPYLSNGYTVAPHNAPVIEGVDPDISPAAQNDESEAKEPTIEKDVPKRKGKMPAKVVDILMEWLNENSHHPYPSEQEKKELMRKTCLSQNQVSNWFINARRRKLPLMLGTDLKQVKVGVKPTGMKKKTSRELKGKTIKTEVGLAPDNPMQPATMPSNPFLNRHSTWQQPTRDFLMARQAKLQSESTMRQAAAPSFFTLPPITSITAMPPANNSPRPSMDQSYVRSEHQPVILPMPHGYTGTQINGYQGYGYPDLLTTSYDANTSYLLPRSA